MERIRTIEEKIVLPAVDGVPGAAEGRARLPEPPEILRTIVSMTPSTRFATLDSDGSPRTVPPNPPSRTGRTGKAMGARSRRMTIAAVGLVASALAVPAWSQESTPLRVRLEARGRSYYLGEGIELAVAVTAGDQRPSLSLPRLSRAEVWTTETAFHPVSASGIGNAVSGTNVYVTRLRLVPRQAGSLLVPPIEAHLNGRSGKSKAITLEIDPLPLAARPAEFLGGVGAFSVESSVTPTTIRLGQEVSYRVTIKGPAAWGSVNRPGLSRLRQLDRATMISDLPDEVDHEPPKRTWVYRIRPARAGTIVLPPVAVAAFDPESERYLTKVTQGLHLSVVAAPIFDLKTFRYPAPDLDAGRRAVIAWAFAALLVLLVISSGIAVVLQQGSLGAGPTGPRPAQQFARRFARNLATRSRVFHPRNADARDARSVVDGLMRYAHLGLGRPPGAITPVEAGQVVLELTGSSRLATEAHSLVERCDRVLFSKPDVDGDTTLVRQACNLFGELGREGGGPPGSLSGRPAPGSG
jgi:hypothetical protein